MPEPTRDRSQLINATVARLMQEFAGALSRAVVEEQVATAMHQLMDGASVTNFVPVLAEQTTRERLRALARAQADATTL
jgi:hypothetical protein